MYGERLKFLREEKELNQYFLSDLLKLNKEVYGQYEREYVTIPLKHLITLCNYFNVSLDFIFGFSNIRKYDFLVYDLDRHKSGERLKSFRKEYKYTQIKLAQILNIAKSMIGAYEAGDFLISTHALYTICKKYNISADYLLGFSNEPKYLN